MYPQWGHWHLSSGSPLKRGAVSKPAGKFSIATFISPHSAWRLTTPSPSKSTGRSFFDALTSSHLLLLVPDLDVDERPGLFRSSVRSSVAPFLRYLRLPTA